MLLSEIQISEMTDAMLERLVFDGIDCKDTPYCEAALVLGTFNPNDDRTPEAVIQYKSGACGKLIMSGGVEWETEYGMLSEAEYMKRYALEQGVPEADIILDNLARTTIENMIGGTLAINRAMGYVSEVKSILIVTSLFHMKRSMLLAEALLPRCMKIYPCAARDSLITRENWCDSELGRQRITAEAGFIQAMVLHGLTPDIEI